MDVSLKLSCEYEVGDCTSIAVERYARWRNDPTNFENGEM